MMELNTLSNVILSICDEVSNKKLQKLSYYIYSWYLVVFGKEIARMDFEAWEHGPVCRRLYNRYRRYGWNSIPRHTGFVLANEKDIEFIKAVLKIYGEMSADELECLSHDEKPWIEARNGLRYNEPSDNLISKKTISEYYSEKTDIYNKIISNIYG